MKNYLIVADSERRNLFQVGLDNGLMVPLLPIKVRRPIAVAYDNINDDVYWTDVIQKVIGQYSLKKRPKTLTTLFRGSNGTHKKFGNSCLTNRIAISENFNLTRGIVILRVGKISYIAIRFHLAEILNMSTFLS